jgi:prostatic aicd phosphatase
MSLQLVLAGLFPPKRTLFEWNNDLNWQPIPYTYEKVENDQLLLMVQNCSRFNHEMKELRHGEYKHIFDDNAEMFAELETIIGRKFETLNDLQVLYLNLHARVMKN